jgi:hypothetical protein
LGFLVIRRKLFNIEYKKTNKLKTRLKLFVLLAFCVILFSNMHCKKDNPEPATIEYVKLDTVFLSYFAFPNGSWWTYKEINTNKTDSIYISNYSIEKIHNTKDDKYYEMLYLTLNSKSETIHGSANPFYFTSEPKDSMKYLYRELYYYGINYSAERFFYPTNPRQKLRGSNTKLYTKILYDTISIQGKLYRDVYQTYNDTSEYYNKIKSEYYCRNVGVIKREHFDGTTWELTNYHINK